MMSPRKDLEAFAILSVAFHEFDRLKSAFEPLAWHKTWDQGGDLIPVHPFRRLCSFRAEPQPKAAKVAQLYDLAIRQVLGD